MLHSKTLSCISQAEFTAQLAQRQFPGINCTADTTAVCSEDPPFYMDDKGSLHLLLIPLKGRHLNGRRLLKSLGS